MAFPRLLILLLPLILYYSITPFLSSSPKVSHIDYKPASNSTGPIFPNQTHSSGFLPVDNQRSLFYWLFDALNNSSEAPLIIYLTGGPGAASEVAVFTGCGPFRIHDETLEVTVNPFSWNKNSHLLFIDQPLGTGYSTSDRLDTTEEEVSAHFYTFMQEFLGKYPQFGGKELYIAGESYAGHYIPAISSYMLKKGGLNMKFKGVAIGNGVVSIYHQAPGYAVYAYENNLTGSFTYEITKKGFEACSYLVNKGYEILSLVHCGSQMLLITGLSPNYSIYDITKQCADGPLCYDFSAVDRFLAQSNVQELLGVQGRPWSQLNKDVSNALGYDILKDYIGDLSFVLEQGIKVLMYHGDRDFICNWRGGETVADNLDWSGKEQFKQMGYTEWKGHGDYKTLGNLTFMKVNEAGHFVPMDQPEVSLDLIERFMKGWDM